MLQGETFRVHVPTMRAAADGPLTDAECFLVDAEDQLDDRSMLYIPVVNTTKIRPGDVPTTRDFIYLASCYEGKRHDLLVDAVRGTELTGHLHPVGPSELDLSNTHITTSDLDERDVVELLQTSRIAVYPGDVTSNPAAMWECVAAGLPIVMNEAIGGGTHLVVPGVTGELAAEDDFLAVMRSVLANRESYAAREHFEKTWDTVTLIERYLAFFREMGWRP
jgi:glycosyltransferase involved in cell wall biosynthesis